jgi:DNA-binding beta-propeller fold protein YncE
MPLRKISHAMNRISGRGVGKVGARKVLVTLALSASLTATLLSATSGDAATYGQIGEAWGKAGTGAGQFFKPGTFGVDPSGGDVYAGDMNSAATNYRIQRFSATGELKASTEFPRKDATSGRLVKLIGFAVDPARERLYAIEACHVLTASSGCVATGRFMALRIHAFSTAGGHLESAGTIAVPSGEMAILEPTSIAVDPLSGDLFVFGEDEGTEVVLPQDGGTEVIRHKVVQRVSTAGASVARFLDTGNVLRPTSPTLAGEAKSLAIGPDGTVYALTGGITAGAMGATSTRAWELPADLSGIDPVPGFAAAAAAEGWPLAQIPANGEGFSAGPGIAISPDGSTLYWREKYAGTETVPESILVRGFSLTEGKTRVLYGGGSSRCLVRTQWAGIGVTGEGAGEELLAFDYGPEQASPPYGAKVVRFGQGGDGCPSPLAKFSVNGHEEDGLVIGRDQTVAFDASASELEAGEAGEGEGEAFPLEYVWNFGDGQHQSVHCVEVEGACPDPAMPTVSHQYTAPGEYTVTLEIKLLGPVFGNPQPVSHTLKVQSPPATLSVFRSGTGSGSVLSSPAGIDCGETCAFEFPGDQLVTLAATADAGSEFIGWSGACTGTGSCQVTMSEARSVTARFELEEGAPPPTHFPLNVLLTGTGTGSVDSSPFGISCGTVCAGEFDSGEMVTLTATAAEGSEFTGWSGSCSGVSACQVPIDEARSVGAEFTPEPPPPPPSFRLTVVKTGEGSGTVASARTGIFCGGKCERDYEEDEKVTLVPTPATGSKFAGWSGGGCAGIGVCRLTMNVARTVTARFDPLPAPPVQTSSAPAAAPATPAATAPPTAPAKKTPHKDPQRCVRKHGKAAQRPTGKRAGRCLKQKQGKSKKNKRGHARRRGQS